VAGPWFTVQEDGGDWQLVETTRISNGERHERVRVELRVRLVESGENQR
jgi:hypothetical protein